jgi:1,4-dihydroxy-2-naphthoate octaprenyltransferase
MDAKTFFLATRPWSFTMTFSSVSIGALLAALEGRFSIALYLVTLGGMIAFHAATNVLNDFYDIKHGVDREGAPTTKYRPHPAAFGQLPLATVFYFALALYALALLAGVFVSYFSGIEVLLIVAAGIVGSVFYTAEPVVLKAKGLGEVVVFVMWGLLIPLGSFMVQTGFASVIPLAAALPIGTLVALVLLANNIRDITYDGSVNTRTVAVILGQQAAVRLYAALLVVTFAVVPLLILAGVLPVWSLIVFLTAKGGWNLWKMFQGQIPDNADPRTAAVALQFSVLLMISLILQIVMPLHLGH